MFKLKKPRSPQCFFTPQSLRLWGIEITKGEWAGGQKTDEFCLFNLVWLFSRYF